MSSNFLLLLLLSLSVLVSTSTANSLELELQFPGNGSVVYSTHPHFSWTGPIPKTHTKSGVEVQVPQDTTIQIVTAQQSQSHELELESGACDFNFNRRGSTLLEEYRRQDQVPAFLMR